MTFVGGTTGSRSGLEFSTHGVQHSLQIEMPTRDVLRFTTSMLATGVETSTEEP